MCRSYRAGKRCQHFQILDGLMGTAAYPKRVVPMWEEVAVAAVVGLAISDSWLCLFMGASFASSDRNLGWGFLAGRTMGIVALCLAIGLLGGALLEHRGALTVAFAFSTVAVAGILAFAIFRPGILGGCGAPSTGEPSDQDCPGGDGGCQEGCGGCVPEEEPREGVCRRIPFGIYLRLKRRSPLLAGAVLGTLRGATPCLKILIVTPLLIVSPPWTVLLMAMAFAGTSAVYPLLGIVSGRTLTTLVGNRRWVRAVGAVGVAGVGLFTLWRYVTAGCVLGA